MEIPRNIVERVYMGSGLPPRPVLKPLRMHVPKDVPPAYVFSGLDQPIDREWNRRMKVAFDEDDNLVVAIRDPFITLKDRSVLLEVGRAVTSKKFQLLDEPDIGIVLVVEEPDLWRGKGVDEVKLLIENIFKNFYTSVNNRGRRRALVLTVEQPLTTKSKEAVSLVSETPWDIPPDVIGTKEEVFASNQLSEKYLSK